MRARLQPASGHRAVAAVAAIFAFLGLLDTPVGAQMYLGGESEPLSALNLDPFHGWSGVQFRGLRTRSGDHRLDETIVSPGLHLATAGSVYHPHLLSFQAQGTGLLQWRILEDGPQSDAALAVSDFDLGLDILREKPGRMRLFAGRNNGWISSPYAASIESRITRWGGEVRADLPSLPVTMTWARNENRERFLSGDRVVDRDQWRLTAVRQGRRVQTAVNLRHEDYRQNLQPQDYRTDGATLNTSFWGPGNLNLYGDGRWLHRYGSRNQHQAGLGISARRPLGGGLDGRAEFRRQGRRPGEPGTPVSVHDSGTLAFHHLLYGSLESDLRLELRRETTDQDQERIASLKESGADLRIRYHRRTRWGTVNLGWNRSRLHREVAAPSREIQVSGEELSLPEAGEARLPWPWIVPGSVGVSDGSGFRVYEEGLDYDLVSSGPYTSIRRRPEGEIPEGSSVLVDYRYTAAQDAVLALDNRGLDARFDGTGSWSVWAGLSRSGESLEAGDPGRPLWEQQRRHAGGCLQLGRLTLENEYEVDHLKDMRLRTNRTRADLTVRPGRRWRAAFGASRNWTRTDSPGRTQEFFQIYGRTRLNGRGNTTLCLEVWTRLDHGRDEQDSAGQNLLGARVQGTHRIGALTMDLQAGFHDADRSGYGDRRFQIAAGIRRVF